MEDRLSSRSLASIAPGAHLEDFEVPGTTRGYEWRLQSAPVPGGVAGPPRRYWPGRLGNDRYGQKPSPRVPQLKRKREARAVMLLRMLICAQAQSVAASAMTQRPWTVPRRCGKRRADMAGHRKRPDHRKLRSKPHPARLQHIESSKVCGSWVPRCWTLQSLGDRLRVQKLCLSDPHRGTAVCIGARMPSYVHTQPDVPPSSATNRAQLRASVVRGC